MGQAKIKAMKPKPTPEQLRQAWHDTEVAEIEHQKLVTEAVANANALIADHQPIEAKRVAARQAFSATL